MDHATVKKLFDLLHAYQKDLLAVSTMGEGIGNIDSDDEHDGYMFATTSHFVCFDKQGNVKRSSHHPRVLVGDKIEGGEVRQSDSGLKYVSGIFTDVK